MIGLIVRRMLITMLLGILMGIVVNEISFLFVKSEAGRPPQRVELDIPKGTAEKIASGQTGTTLPTNIVFVIGDTLVVKNNDVVDHHLGPLFIPAGTTASMTLTEANNLAYSCSFVPTKYIGLDVREPVTFATRLYGIFIAGIPLGFLIAVYSFLVWPIKPAASEAL